MPFADDFLRNFVVATFVSCQHHSVEDEMRKNASESKKKLRNVEIKIYAAYCHIELQGTESNCDRSLALTLTSFNLG